MYYNNSTPFTNVSPQEMFDTYKNQYNQLIEHIDQINRFQREIFNQLQINNERFISGYNDNAQNINFLYQNLDALRLNMFSVYRPIHLNPPLSSPLDTPPNIQQNNMPNPSNNPLSNTTNFTVGRESTETSDGFRTAGNPINTSDNSTSNATNNQTTVNSTTENSTSNSSRRSRYNIPLQETNDLVDVPVYPSVEQINNAIRTLRFSTINNPLNERCPIGLGYFESDDMVSQIIHCGHIFTTSEIQSWFHSNVHCPVCRYDIRENNPPNSSNNIENQNTNNRTRNRPRNRVRNNDNIFNEVMSQFLNSYLDSSNNMDTSNNII